ncbi:hypothetical protein AKJ09_06804 [Labilithrix luteola]|uniref:Uncharacterized protein n=1 Tax=Labilithrix luteola TaxID=1391654 RepID=A0A0K1Q2U9_9BACT|nr:hypothetical protein AKJ09_06804 [Labilithrix luteola]
MYADLQGLFGSALGANVIKNVVGLAGDLPAESRKCIDDLVPGVREFAMGSSSEGDLTILRFDPAATKRVEACVRLLPDQKQSPAKVAGADVAWSDRDAVLAIAPGVMVNGPQALVESALAGKGSGAGLSRIKLAKDEYLVWSGGDDGMITKGSVLASDERFRVGGTIEFPDESFAKMVQGKVAQGQGMLSAMLPADKSMNDATRARLSKALSCDRNGKQLACSFELVESPADQGRDLGALAAAAVGGVRSYMTSAKSAEAKNTIGRIAKDLVANWESEPVPGKPRAKRKLVSYPAVPKTIPKGVKVTTQAADWKAWAPLHFEMTSPQYYQYEVKAAKDGESAEIIARGDLNGDGKTSQFKVLVKIDRAKQNVLFVSPTIEETDPQE